MAKLITIHQSIPFGGEHNKRLKLVRFFVDITGSAAEIVPDDVGLTKFLSVVSGSEIGSPHVMDAVPEAIAGPGMKLRHIDYGAAEPASTTDIPVGEYTITVLGEY